MFAQILAEIHAIRTILERAYPEFLLETRDSTNPITYPEAGERLVRPVEANDQAIFARSNKQCDRCGRYYLARKDNPNVRTTRHLYVVKFLEGPATSCANCSNAALRVATLEEWKKSWKGPKFT
jgi:hypothetical protein